MKYTIELFETLKSTNQYLESLEPTPDEGRVIRAINQTGGVGQQGNVWKSEADKNLTFSILLRPTFLSIPDRFMLTKAISLAMVDYLRTVLPNSFVSIKWPNDIYVGKDKIGGMLIYNKFRGMSFNSSVVGIGFNVNQTLFSRDIPNPTSLKIITAKDYDLPTELTKICDSISVRYEELRNGNHAKLDKEYLENLLYLGQEREYYYKEKPLVATIEGVNKEGMLLLNTSDNKQIICDLKELKFIH